MTCDQLVSTCVGWPNSGKLRRPEWEFEFDQDQKSTSVITSPCKSTQVAGKTGPFDWGFKGLCTSGLLWSNHSTIMD